MQPTPLSAQSSPSWWIGPIFNELVIALFPVLTYYAAVSSRLPARVAVHFNEYGMPTRFEDKNSMDALLGFIGLGILGFLIGKILRLIILLPIHFSRNENNRRIGAKMATYAEFFLVFLSLPDHSKDKPGKYGQPGRHSQSHLHKPEHISSAPGQRLP